MDIAFRSTSALADAIRTREIGCLELLDHYLARVERLNPRLNAIVTLDVDARARARAARPTSALARGEIWGPLHGVPFTIKDSFETAGAADDVRVVADRRVTCPRRTRSPSRGCARAGRRHLRQDERADARERRAELQPDLRRRRTTRGTRRARPADRRAAPRPRSPRGSPAATSAATSAGRSARRRAGAAIFGHKTTWGIIPGRGHIPGPPGTLAESRPRRVRTDRAARADDLDLGLDVMVGPSPEDARAWRIELPPARRDDAEARIAWRSGSTIRPRRSTARCGACSQGAVDALRRRGGPVVDRRPDVDFARARAGLLPAALSDRPRGHAGRRVREHGAAWRRRSRPTTDSPLARSARAATIRHRDWLRLHEQRKHMQARFADFFRDVDVLLMPIVPDGGHPTRPQRAVPGPHDHRRRRADRLHSSSSVDRARRRFAHLPATAAPGRTNGERPARRHADRRAVSRGSHDDRRRAAHDRGGRRLRAAAGVRVMAPDLEAILRDGIVGSPLGRLLGMELVDAARSRARAPARSAPR